MCQILKFLNNCVKKYMKLFCYEPTNLQISNLYNVTSILIIGYVGYVVLSKVRYTFDAAFRDHIPMS